MDKEYKGLKENLERFKNDLTDEKMRLLFSIAYKQGYDQALSMTNVVEQSEQLFCDCSQGKGVDIDEDGFPYCIDCQKNVAK